jgi:hypothetical protein
MGQDSRLIEKNQTCGIEAQHLLTVFLWLLGTIRPLLLAGA